MRIRRLDDRLIRRIAAGEVVERPASVVKELVENSIDARAGSIEVEIVGGGIDRVLVADDGEGMTPEELALAVERHTTSKIASEEDLRRISTLGFRGEALAAICAVSKVRLVSRTPDSPSGYELIVEGGEKLSGRPAPRRVGTTVEVRDLFYNVPARRKFLLSPKAEARHCLGVLRRLALGHPAIRFHIISGGREAFSLPPVQDPLERIAQIYGQGLSKRLIPVEMREPGYNLRAFLGPPELQRPTRSEQHLFLSGRPISLGTLGGVLEEVYLHYLPKGAHPVFFIYLDADPSLVDVNVHPQKHEVRFRNEAAVKDLLSRAAERALGKRAVRVVPPPGRPPAPDVVPVGMPVARRGPAWKVVGQIGQGFILLETPEGLEIVDQHVAHERVLFERFLGAKEVQPHMLLVPMPLELPRDRAEALKGILPKLRTLGVILEPFGENAFLIRGWPGPLAESQSRKGFVRPLESIAEKAVEGRDLSREELWKELACAAAVERADRLSREEQEELIRQWKATKEPARCPHGRPVVLKITWKDLERHLGVT